MFADAILNIAHRFLSEDAGASSSNQLVIVLGSVLVAVVTSGFAYASSRLVLRKEKRRESESVDEESAITPPTPRAAVKHYDAIVIWLAYRHPEIDPRKIKTGYESEEEVRRAV